MDSVSSVIKFSASHEARWLLIHRSSRRVSACSMKRFASAGVGCTPDIFASEGEFFFAGAWARATEANRTTASTSRPNFLWGDEYETDGIDAILYSLPLIDW